MPNFRKEFYRIPSKGRIAGVCAGVAEVYGVSVSKVRWTYSIAFILSVPMLTVYLIQWFLYPVKEEAPQECAGP